MTPASPKFPDPAVALHQVARVLSERDRFLICSHVRPDGDCVGSTLGLLLTLEAMGKQVVAYNPSPVPDNLSFLPASQRIQNHFNGYVPDVTVFVDCGGPDRVDKGFQPVGYIVNIDHHATNENFGDINYVDVAATSVGEQIANLVEVLRVPLTPEIASNLLASIITDTGGFRYPNTTIRTFELAARLTEAGANPARLAQEIYENRSRESLWLQGKVLGALHFECQNTLVWGEIDWQMYKTIGGTDHEPDGLVSDIRGIRGVEVSVLIHELEEGGLRVGLRSKGHIDVSKIASELGGGGHHNASGAYIPGNYEELKKRVIGISKRHVAKALGMPAEA